MRKCKIKIKHFYEFYVISVWFIILSICIFVLKNKRIFLVACRLMSWMILTKGETYPAQSRKLVVVRQCVIWQSTAFIILCLKKGQNSHFKTQNSAFKPRISFVGGQRLAACYTIAGNAEISEQRLASGSSPDWLHLYNPNAHSVLPK